MALASAALLRPADEGHSCGCDSSTWEEKGTGSSLRQWYESGQLHDAGVQEDASDKEQKRRELVAAIRMDSVRKSFGLLRDLRRGIDVPVTDRGETPLAVACRAGSLQVMAALMKQGADPAAVDAQGTSCIALACAEGHLEVVRRLGRDRRVDAGCCDSAGEAPLHKAVTFGHLDIAHYLLSMREGGGRERANALTTAQSRLEGPLHIAMRRLSRPHKSLGKKPRRYEMLQLLLEYGADPAICDVHGDTPLHICARQGDLKGLWICLAEVSDVGAVTATSNASGMTVLDEADFGGWLVVPLARVLPQVLRKRVVAWMFNEFFMLWSA